MLNVIKESRYSLLGAWLVILLGTCFYAYEVLLRIIPGVMKQDLMMHYGISSAKLSGISALYFLMYAPMQMPVGMLMDRYGPKLLLTLSGLSCATGILLLSMTKLVFVAMLSRLLIGFGSAFAFVGVLKLASVLLPSNQFAVVSGLTLALGMLGATIGDRLVSSLLLIENWQIICMKAAVVGMVLTFMMFTLIPYDMHKNSDPEEQADLYEILQGKLALIKNPQIWLAALIGCLSFTPVTLFAEHFGIEFLGVKYGISHVEAAALNSYIFIGWMLGGPLVCSISDYVKSRKMPVLIGMVMSLVLCIVVLYGNVPLAWMPQVLMLFGIFNSTQVIVFPIAKEISEKHYTATAVSLINMICMLSGLMQGIVGYLYDYTKWVLIKTRQLEALDLISFKVAYIPLPLFLICAIICALMLKETYCEESLSA